MEDWKLEPAHDHGLSSQDAAKSLKRESGLIHTFTHLVWWAGVRAYLKAYHRLRIVNAQRIPQKPPFVLIANHSSHLDALIMAAPLPWGVRDRIFPIAAADVFFETPAITFFAAAMLNALPMYRRNRGAHALAELRERLVNEPCAFILFPEGARSRDGGMLPFKAGLGMIVAGTNVPVVPCYLEGPFRALPADRKVPRPARLEMRIGESLNFADTSNDRPGWNDVAQRCRESIERLRDSRA